jgi:hypothetical protein
MDREQGNTLYRARDFVGANAIYISCLNQEKNCTEPSRTKLAIICNNLSACAKKIGNDEEVIFYAQRCLEYDAMNAKSYLRMAHFCPENDRYLYAAWALLGRDSIRNLISSRSGAFEGKVTLAKTAATLRTNCTIGTHVIVLPPGRYALDSAAKDGTPIIIGRGCSVRVIGLGEVVLIKGSVNAFYVVDGGNLLVENISIIESVKNPVGAALATSGLGSKLQLQGCKFEGGGGVTVDEYGRVSMNNCLFFQMTVQGIEVRSGGSAEICSSKFHSCQRAVSGHCHAAEICLTDCEIFDSILEGLMFDGAKPAAEARAVNVKTYNQALSRDSASTFTEDEEWRWRLLQVAHTHSASFKPNGPVHSTLRVRLERCHVKASGLHGIECADGALVEIIESRIENVKNGPTREALLVKQFRSHMPTLPMKMVEKMVKTHMKQGKPFGGGVNIRGGASVVMSHCSLAGNACGVHVDFNFAGDVIIDNCLFCDNKLDIHESVSVPNDPNGFWSKPAYISKMRKFAKDQRDMITDVAPLASIKQNQTRPTSRGPTKSKTTSNMSRQPFLNVRESYYPMGNSFGVDVLALCAHQLKGVNLHTHHFHAALLACGDVRNATETVAAWWRLHSGSQAHLTLVMNDISTSVLVRDMVLLELMHRNAAPEVITAVWASAALNKQTYVQLRAALEAVFTEGGDTPAWLDLTAKSADWNQCVNAFLDTSVRADQMHKILACRGNHELSVSKTCLAVGERHRKEVDSYIKTLTLGEGNDDDKTFANVTLLEAPDMRPSIYFSSSVFRSLGPFDCTKGDLTSALTAHIGGLAVDICAALRSGRVVIKVVGGDSFDVPTALSRDKATCSVYDIVDTSNLADYCGLANLLLLGIRIGRSVRTQTMHARLANMSSASYFENSFGVDAEAFADLACLRLHSCSTLLFSFEGF